MLFGVFWLIFRANSKKNHIKLLLHWITMPLNVNIKRLIVELSIILGLLSFCVFFSVNSLLVKIFIPKCVSAPSNWTYSKLKSSFMFISPPLIISPNRPLTLPTWARMSKQHLYSTSLLDVPLFSSSPNPKNLVIFDSVSLYSIHSVGN